MEKFEEWWQSTQIKGVFTFPVERSQASRAWNHQQAKIDKLEQEKRELVEALGKMPCIGNCRSDERDRFYGIKALCFKCTVLTKIKSEGRDE